LGKSLTEHNISALHPATEASGPAPLACSHLAVYIIAYTTDEDPSMPSASWTDLPDDVLAILRRGAVLPAHPLALDERRQFDRQSQRALSRYYIDAGAGGLAVGVHATQFQIREAGLYRPVL